MKNSRPEAWLISLQVDLDTIGLKSLQAVLRRAGFEAVLLYLPGLQPEDRELMETVAAMLRDHDPGFVGISLMSHEYAAAAALTTCIRQTAGDRPIVWGGIHPTIAPEMCLDHADYVCVGEGETAIGAFARALQDGTSIDRIDNFWYKKTGVVVKNPLAPLIEDLDRLPVAEHFPRHSLIAHGGRILPLDKRLFKRYARWRGTVYSFTSSRGCPFTCAYCCNDILVRLYGTRKIRRRSVDSIMAELESAIRQYPEIVYINFQDDCFLACSETYLTAFCRDYQDRIGRPFIVRCIPAFVSQSRLLRLKQAGLAWISMGLQSGSDRVLRDVYNRQSLSHDFLKAAGIIRKAGVAAYYDIILDNPLETDADRLKTIDVLARVPRPFFLQLFSLVLYPGTRLYRRLHEQSDDCPAGYLVKNYHAYRKTDLNRLIRLSACWPPSLIERLVSLYGRNPSARGFRVLLRTLDLVSVLLVEPVIYFRLIRISLRGDTARAIRLLPAFSRIGFSRYIKWFHGKTAKRLERLLHDPASRME